MFPSLELGWIAHKYKDIPYPKIIFVDESDSHIAGLYLEPEYNEKYTLDGRIINCENGAIVVNAGITPEYNCFW